MAVTIPPSSRVATEVAVPAARHRTPRSGTALVFALVAACAYAVFADGAIGLPEEPRLQIGLGLIAIVAAVGWLLSGTLVLRAPATAWVGVGLLALFAAWCALTLLWSVTPDHTWAHVNRAFAYTLVVVLAIAAGSSTPRAIERLAVGWLVVAVTCALYAIGGKVIPGVHLLGIDFNHTAAASRLRAPLEYWNALSLVCVLAIPIALRLATDLALTARARLAALAALFTLVVCLGMTYSRGGIIALLIALAVMMALGGARLRSLPVLGVVALATVPVFMMAFTRSALTGLYVPLGERISDGRLLGAVIVGCLLALLAVGWALLTLEKRMTWSPTRTRLVRRGLWSVVGVAALACVVAALAASGGPGAAADRAWASFTTTKKDKVSDPARIVSATSGNRWVWWEEAVGAWSERPLEGWGAGSFRVTHKLYRQVEIAVAQPHSMPLQFLAETGLIGALLAYGGLCFLTFSALDRVRGMARGRERDLAVALLAGGAAWLVHGLIDWDWDIPGVTVPALLFIGVLVAIPPRQLRGQLPTDPPERPVGSRGVALVAASLLLGLAIVSAWLPALADSKADAALLVSREAGPAELGRATAQAELGARLDPTSVRPLLAAASLAEGRSRLLDARNYLIEAVDRQPYSYAAWARLLRLAILTADRPGAKAAAERIRELDPLSSATPSFAARLALFSVPASASPTATGTPLSPKYRAGGATSTTPGPPAEGPAAGSPTPRRTVPAPERANPAP
ncbi:hypothetical protein BH20ACT17_BH20ACT17_19440 [soil metagenome]